MCSLRSNITRLCAVCTLSTYRCLHTHGLQVNEPIRVFSNNTYMLTVNQNHTSLTLRMPSFQLLKCFSDTNKGIISLPFISHWKMSISTMHLILWSVLNSFQKWSDVVELRNVTSETVLKHLSNQVHFTDCLHSEITLVRTGYCKMWSSYIESYYSSAHWVWKTFYFLPFI